MRCLESVSTLTASRTLGTASDEDLSDVSTRMKYAFPLWCFLLAGAGSNLPAHTSAEEHARLLAEQLHEAPRDPKLYQKRATLARRQGDWQAALDDLKRAEALGGDEVEIGVERAEVFMASRRPGETAEALNRVLSQQPDHVRAHWLRGQALVELGEVDDGLAEMAASYADSRRRTPEMLLELVKANATAGRFDYAIDSLDRGLREFGALTVFQKRALELEYCLGRDEAASERATQIQDPWFRRVLEAEALAASGRRLEAKSRYDELSSDLGANYQQTRQSLRIQRRVDLGLKALNSQELSNLMAPHCHRKTSL